MLPAFITNLFRPALGGEGNRHKYGALAPSEAEIQPEEGRPIGNVSEEVQALIDEHAKKTKRRRILKIIFAIMVAISIFLVTSFAT